MSVLVSVILPSFKRGALLDLGLYSLTKQYTSFNFEIIVLNDGIEDDTESVCKKYSNVRYFFTGQRNTKEKSIWRVPGFAINIGVKQAKGDVIVLSCPEIWHLTENSLGSVVAALKPNTLTSPKTIYFDDDNKILPYLLSDSFNKQLEIPNGFLKSHCPNTGKGTAYTMPFFMAMYKQDFIDIGGYDEDFTGYAGDDNDFIGRLKMTHSREFLNNVAVVHLHHEGTNMGNNSDNESWKFNYVLWRSRKGVLNRNVGREWGVL